MPRPDLGSPGLAAVGMPSGGYWLKVAEDVLTVCGSRAEVLGLMGLVDFVLIDLFMIVIPYLPQ